MDYGVYVIRYRHRRRPTQEGDLLIIIACILAINSYELIKQLEICWHLLGPYIFFNAGT